MEVEQSNCYILQTSQPPGSVYIVRATHFHSEIGQSRSEIPAIMQDLGVQND